MIFLSTSSARRTTLRVAEIANAVEFLSTSSARRTTFCHFKFIFLVSNFYPRPPRGGRRTISCDTPRSHIFLSTSSARRTTASVSMVGTCFCTFLSTSSARRTTCPFSAGSGQVRYFYPRPPQGGRLGGGSSGAGGAISIHVLRKEDDQSIGVNAVCPKNFYPRPPQGGRHAGIQYSAQIVHISIHVLRKEDDKLGSEP